MNITVILIETLVLIVLFTIAVAAGRCFGAVGELDNMMENRRTKSERVRIR